MIYFILSVLLLLSLLYILKLRNQCKMLSQEYTFVNTNKNLQRSYDELIVYLQNRKSKFSVESKVTILCMWMKILLYLPQPCIDITKAIPNKVDIEDDTLTSARHKKELIDALVVLKYSSSFDVVEFTVAVHNLIHILFK